MMIKRLDLWGLAAAIVFFLIFTELDLTVTAWFYDSGQGGFYWRKAWWADLVYDAVKWISYAIILAFLGWCVLMLFKPKSTSAANKSRIVFVVLCLIVGPALVVNMGFKDNWGRARPHHIEQFGGDARYTPPLEPASQCDTNCSFVCGHASVGFALFAFAFITGRRRRYIWAGIVLGGFIGWIRIVQGGHFFSDVIFSGYAVWFSTLSVWWLLNKLGWLRSIEQRAANQSSVPQAATTGE